MSEATRTSRSNMRRIGFYALAVVIVACAAMFVIGRYQLGRARRIQREAEVKLTQATIYIANQTIQAALDAQRQVSARNWGTAREDMARVAEGIRVMEQIAPKHMQSQIGHLKRKATDAERAVGEDSDQSLEMISDVLQSLQGIKDQPFAG